ncbi:MAG: glycoside hydrolase family 25 protein [Anaerolineaceae bacterium]|nr:glycoside hydrolase family 25 protein [Anaerolineaceae bacterium]
MIPGIDVSHWEQEIDWSEVKRSGVKFAFIKATEFPEKRTSLFIDNELRKNIKGASENGILWGAYHFFRTHVDPVIQAKVFCETVGEFKSLPPVLDLEAADLKGERLNYKVRLFLDETERITNKRPIIYSSPGFWGSYMACEKMSHTNWAREYTLWIAQYTTLWPRPLYPWAGWDFWQYTDKGKIPGITSHVDLNWFNGSVEELEWKYKTSDNSHLDTYELARDANLGIEKINDGAKLSPIAQVQESFRGDFQEPFQQLSIIDHQDKKITRRNRKAIPELDNNQREEEWIKAYFLQNSEIL